MRDEQVTEAVVADEAPAEPAAAEAVPAADAAPERGARACLAAPAIGQGSAAGDLVEAAAERAEISKDVLLAATDAFGVRTQRGQWWPPEFR